MELRKSFMLVLVATVPVLFASAPAPAQEEVVGSEEEPWIVEDETLDDEYIEIVPATEEEAAAAYGEVVERAVPAILQKQLDLLVQVEEIFVGVAKRAAEAILLQSTGCDRDDALAANAMLIMGSAALPIPLTVTGGAIGGIIATVAGAPAAEGGGAIPTLGIVAGAGTGATIGVVQLMAVGYFVAQDVRKVISDPKYPPCDPQRFQISTAVLARGEGGETIDLDLDEADAWVDYAEEPSEVTERGVNLATQAGPYESLLIHVFKEMTNNKIYDISVNWDRSRYIPVALKPQVRALRRHMEPTIDFLAYVKRYNRFPGGRPAQPLATALERVSPTLIANTSSLRTRFLTAMGMGSTRLKLRNGKLAWTTPSALRLVGLPPTVSGNVSLGSISLGPFSVSLSPGPFDVNLGQASLSGSRVKVAYSISKGSRLASISVYYRPPYGRRITFFRFNGSLPSTVRGSLYYKMTAAGPVIDRVDLGSVSLSVPKFPAPPIPGLQKTIDDIRSQIGRKVKRAASSALPLRAILDRAASAAKKNLLKTVKGLAGSLGLKNIDGIVSVSISGGVLNVKVSGHKVTYRLPALPPIGTVRSALAGATRRLRALR